MKFFRDENNKVFAFEIDGSQDEFIDKNLISITETEALAITNPPPTAEEIQAETNAAALAYLASTDWYVTRFAETGFAIPANISAARQAARESVL